MSILVFHGSTAVVDRPEIRSVSRPLDFGAGFYVTSIRERAEEWAQKKAMKEHNDPIVSVYSLDINLLQKQLCTKSFKGTSDNWLDFVLKHRRTTAYVRQTVRDNGAASNRRFIANLGVHHTFDMVTGEVANDDVFDSIEFYESGVISKAELKRRLKTKQKNDQLCFCTPESLGYLSFNDSFSKVR